MSPKEIAEVRKSLYRVQLGYRVSVLLLKLAINLYGKLKVERLDYTHMYWFLGIFTASRNLLHILVLNLVHAK